MPGMMATPILILQVNLIVSLHWIQSTLVSKCIPAEALERNYPTNMLDHLKACRLIWEIKIPYCCELQSSELFLEWLTGMSTSLANVRITDPCRKWFNNCFSKVSQKVFNHSTHHHGSVRGPTHSKHYKDNAQRLRQFQRIIFVLLQLIRYFLHLFTVKKRKG